MYMLSKHRHGQMPPFQLPLQKESVQKELPPRIHYFRAFSLEAAAYIEASKGVHLNTDNIFQKSQSGSYRYFLVYL